MPVGTDAGRRGRGLRGLREPSDSEATVRARGLGSTCTPDQGVPLLQLASSPGHVSWAQSTAGQAGQAARDGAARSSSLTQSASTPLLSQRPAHPAHQSPRPRPTPRAFPAPSGCSQGLKWPRRPACKLPAGLPGRGCLLPEPLLRCAAVRCLSAWACCSDRTPARTLFSLAALGGVRGCLGVLCWLGWVQKRGRRSRFDKI